MKPPAEEGNPDPSRTSVGTLASDPAAEVPSLPQGEPRAGRSTKAANSLPRASTLLRGFLPVAVIAAPLLTWLAFPTPPTTPTPNWEYIGGFGAVLVLLLVTPLWLGIRSLDRAEGMQYEIQQALRLTEARFRSLTEANAQLVWMADSAGNLFEMPGWQSFTGQPLERALRLGWVDILHPEDRAYALRSWKTCQEFCVPFHLECRARHHDGGYRFVTIRAVPALNPDGTLREWIGSWTDIHDNRTSNLMEARLAAIVDSSNDAIISKTLTGVITSWNRSAERLFGYKAQEIIGQPILRLVPEDRRQEEEWILSRICRGERVNHYDTIRIRKDGTSIPISLTISPIRESGGRIVGASKIARDISERMAAENLIRSLNTKLEARVQERTSQLEAANRELEAFSYSVSHDLRAPARAVHGFASMLMEDYGTTLDAEANRILKVIQNEALRMGQLIDDLLAFSRVGRQNLRRARVDMNEQVKAILSELEDQAQHRLPQIKLEPLPEAEADPSMVRQVWMNLLSNAIKYSSKNPSPQIEISGTKAANECIYSVRDNGVGFAMEQSDKLFGVFQRLHTEEEFHGNGVGLALAQRIVEKHGGRIWASAKRDEGATFSFSLPVPSQGT